MMLCSCLLLCGCQVEPKRPTDYERVSKQIDRSLSEALAQASDAGDIRVAVRMLSTSSQDYSVLSGLLRYADESVVVAARPQAFAASGLRIGVAGPDFATRLNLAKQQLQYSEDSELFIVVSEGQPGYISIGTEIAVPQFYYMGRRYSGVEYGFRSAGRSLEVTARKLADGWLELKLTPVFSRFLNDGGDIKLTELTTTVIAAPGQTIVMGGSDSADQNVANALLSGQTYTTNTRTLITVTPYIE